MRVRVWPATCQGQVTVPPSKSLAHRAVICAALAPGESEISNVDFSQDIEATVAGMRALGAELEAAGDRLRVRGCRPAHRQQAVEIFCRESGSTLRFLLPLLALSAAPARLTGENRLLQRPQGVYETIWRQQGLDFEHTAAAISLRGPLRPGSFRLPGDVSSQFVSGLLFALPLLAGDSQIEIESPFESRSYVLLTLEMLACFGVEAHFEEDNRLLIPGGQAYRPQKVQVEGDYSQAAFFAVLAAIGGEVTCLGLEPQSRQGDRAVLTARDRAGAQVEPVAGGYRIAAAPLRDQVIDLADCPDLGPIFMVLAAFCEGETRIIHAGRLRYKESDRIAAMEAELSKLGVDIRSQGEEIYVTGGGIPPANGTAPLLYGHRDHRVVMSLAVAAAAGAGPLCIEGAEAIAKSYPRFFEDLAKMGVKVEQWDD